jgi:hypothetical protein
MADAILAATCFGHDLYPENVICNDWEQVSRAVLLALQDGHEMFPVDLAVAHTYVIVPSAGRAVLVAPDVARSAVDALARACGPDVAVCDTCPRGLAPLVGLLPVGAGAVVVVLALCRDCTAFITDVFSSAHLITATEN